MTASNCSDVQAAVASSLLVIEMGCCLVCIVHTASFAEATNMQ